MNIMDIIITGKMVMKIGPTEYWASAGHIYKLNLNGDGSISAVDTAGKKPIDNIRGLTEIYDDCLNLLIILSMCRFEDRFEIHHPNDQFRARELERYHSTSFFQRAQELCFDAEKLGIDRLIGDGTVTVTVTKLMNRIEEKKKNDQIRSSSGRDHSDQRRLDSMFAD